VALGGLAKAELRVLDLLGREVLQQGTDGPLTTLDLTGQPAGTYFVRVQAHGFGQTLKVVKK
jgi:hypothetical protein